MNEPAAPVDVDRIRDVIEPRLQWTEGRSGDGPWVVGLGEPTHGTLEARVLATHVIDEVVRRHERVAVFGEWCDVEGVEIDAFVAASEAGGRVPEVGGAPFRSETLAAMWRRLQTQRQEHQRYVRIYGMRPCVPKYQVARLAALVEAGSAARLRAAARREDVPAIRAELERIELGVRGAPSPMVAYQTSLVEQSLAMVDADAAYEDDAAMARNVRHVVERLEPEIDVVVVLAHNGHVTAARRHVLPNARTVVQARLGGLLREWKGAEYLAVGVLVGDGEFCAAPVARPRARRGRRFRIERATGAIESTLMEVAREPWSLRMDRAEPIFPDPAYHLQVGLQWGWPMTVLAGAAYVGESLEAAYDVIVFFPETHADRAPGCS